MFYISEIQSTSPLSFKSVLQQTVYSALEQLDIPFERVETDEAITMADCVCINRKLQMEMVKTLFLCNRQQTDFYLFVTKGDKPFSSKLFSHTLSISRVSFAPATMLNSMLQTPIGAATILSLLVDTDNKVRIVVDRDVMDEEYYGCSDGTTTGYLKMKTEDVTTRFLDYTHHSLIVVNV